VFGIKDQDRQGLFKTESDSLHWFRVPTDGRYQIQCCGGKGRLGAGRGQECKSEVELKEGTELIIWTGNEQGSSGVLLVHQHERQTVAVPIVVAGGGDGGGKDATGQEAVKTHTEQGGKKGKDGFRGAAGLTQDGEREDETESEEETESFESKQSEEETESEDETESDSEEEQDSVKNEEEPKSEESKQSKEKESKSKAVDLGWGISVVRVLHWILAKHDWQVEELQTHIQTNDYPKWRGGSAFGGAGAGVNGGSGFAGGSSLVLGVFVSCSRVLLPGLFCFVFLLFFPGSPVSLSCPVVCLLLFLSRPSVRPSPRSSFVWSSFPSFVSSLCPDPSKNQVSICQRHHQGRCFGFVSLLLVRVCVSLVCFLFFFLSVNVCVFQSHHSSNTPSSPTPSSVLPTCSLAEACPHWRLCQHHLTGCPQNT